jgi:hypothetical protein
MLVEPAMRARRVVRGQHPAARAAGFFRSTGLARSSKTLMLSGAGAKVFPWAITGVCPPDAPQ